MLLQVFVANLRASDDLRIARDANDRIANCHTEKSNCLKRHGPSGGIDRNGVLGDHSDEVVVTPRMLMIALHVPFRGPPLEAFFILGLVAGAGISP